MRSPAAERNLRRLVAKLATAEPDDVDMVLESLDPAQRREVRALLDAYAPAQLQIAPPPALQPPAPAPVAADISHLAGLSPWLAERAAGVGGAFRMTPAALAALAHAAKALPADQGLAMDAAAPERQRGVNPFRRGSRAR